MSGLTVPFDEFVAGRGPALLRFAYLLTGDGGLAEDLVQEALIRAHRRWRGQVRVTHPEAYVRRIVVNEYTNWRRRRSNHELPGPIPDGATGDTADVADGLVERDLVWRILACLPRRQRAVLVLRYYEALPDAEIADLLEATEGTVRSLAARAFATLRDHPQLVTRTGPTTSRREELP